MKSPAARFEARAGLGGETEENENE